MLALWCENVKCKNKYPVLHDDPAHPQEENRREQRHEEHRGDEDFERHRVAPRKHELTRCEQRVVLLRGQLRGFQVHFPRQPLLDSEGNVHEKPHRARECVHTDHVVHARDQPVRDEPILHAPVQRPLDQRGVTQKREGHLHRHGRLLGSGGHVVLPLRKLVRRHDQDAVAQTHGQRGQHGREVAQTFRLRVARTLHRFLVVHAIGCGAEVLLQDGQEIGRREAARHQREHNQIHLQSCARLLFLRAAEIFPIHLCTECDSSWRCQAGFEIASV